MNHVPSLARTLLAASISLAFGSTFAQTSTSSADEKADTGATQSITIVTSRKRAEQQIDVPVAISVLRGEALEREGTTEVTSLFGKIPALYFSQNAAAASPQKDNRFLTLRGVGANPVVEPSVGVFIDGVYQPSLAFDAGFLDVERIEVLRGPQGTLFGRNTEAGAVSVITRKPGGAFRGRAGLSVDKQKQTAYASVSTPLVENTLAASVLVTNSSDRGYYANTTLGTQVDDIRSVGARTALRWFAGERTTVDFAVDANRKKGVEVGSGVNNAAPAGTFTVADDSPGNMAERQEGGALTIEHDFGGMVLTSITGYRKVFSDRQYDIDGQGSGATNLRNVQRIQNTQKSVSQELRLASTGKGPLTWLGGLYVYQAQDDNRAPLRYETQFPAPGATGFIRSDQDRKGQALFGQVGYTLLGGFLELNGGLRIGRDEVDGDRNNILQIPAFGLNRNVSTKRSATYNNTSPMLQAALKWDKSLMSYATLARGYKSGGFQRLPTSSNPYLPISNETADSIELGVKKSLLGDKVYLTAALFQVKIKDMQVPSLVINPDTNLPAVTVGNAGKATTQGVELDLQWEVTPNFSVSAGLSTLDAKFDRFIFPTSTTASIDLSGTDFPNAPKHMANLSMSYRQPLKSGMELTAGMQYRKIGKFHTGLGAGVDRRFDNPGYELLDLNVGLLLQKKTEISVFLRNALDEYYTTGVIPGAGVPDFRQVGAPRAVGVRLISQF